MFFFNPLENQKRIKIQDQCFSVLTKRGTTVIQSFQQGSLE